MPLQVQPVCPAEQRVRYGCLTSGTANNTTATNSQGILPAARSTRLPVLVASLQAFLVQAASEALPEFWVCPGSTGSG